MRQFDGLAVSGDLMRGHIDYDIAIVQAFVHRANRAPYQGAQARAHFLETERLGHVIIGAGIQPLDALFDCVLRRQYQHRHIAFLFTRTAQHFQPADFGQAQVQYHHVKCRITDELHRRLAILRPLDRVVFTLQPGAHALAEQVIVFDKQYFHSSGRRVC